MLAGLLGQIDRAPRQRACALQLPRSGEGERLQVGQLDLGPVTLRLLELPFHRCVVASEECEVKIKFGVVGPRYLSVRSSPERRRSFVEAIEIHVAGGRIGVAEWRLGIGSLRFCGAFNAALIPSRSLDDETGGQTVVVERARIGLCPQVERPERLL